MTAPILLVTGGSRGLGAATAKLAAQRGFDVAINYKGNKAAADSVYALSTCSVGDRNRSNSVASC